ncbi:MAG TPA: protein kinase [Thermoleophilaceae bacterium]
MSTPQEVAGRYRLDKRLGAGGMSTVFMALDTVLERPVAVKLLAEHLADDEAFVARFRREALAAARLQHPNIVQVFDSGLDEPSDRHYIVMEYVEGPSCADLIRDQGVLDIQQAVSIIRDACHGLDYAHRAGVVHRDVKPGNLLISRDTGAAKLADFGIAKAAEQTRITQVGSVLGTAAYLSPEQATGAESTPASDIYSLGVCAYQFLSGRLPHEYGSLTELALKQQNESVEPIRAFRPEVPEALDRAIRVCLERDPAARYSTALDMAQAIEAGFRGDQSEVTQVLQRTGALGAGDPDATQALPRTQMGRMDPLPPRTSMMESAPAPAAARARERQPARRKSGRGEGLRRLVIALAVILAIVAVVLIVTNGGGANKGPVNSGDVHGQIDGLKQLIQDNEK